jgi:hypothetical protein
VGVLVRFIVLLHEELVIGSRVHVEAVGTTILERGVDVGPERSAVGDS